MGLSVTAVNPALANIYVPRVLSETLNCRGAEVGSDSGGREPAPTPKTLSNLIASSLSTAGTVARAIGMPMSRHPFVALGSESL